MVEFGEYFKKLIKVMGIIENISTNKEKHRIYIEK